MKTQAILVQLLLVIQLSVFSQTKFATSTNNTKAIGLNKESALNAFNLDQENVDWQAKAQQYSCI